MKKILSLTMAALMVVSMVPTAFAADVDYQNGTEVEYTGSRTTVNADGTETHNAEYTITVPALLAPGGSGTVTLEGYWPSDATVKVTADASVDMLNSINNADKKTLTVTFAGIELAGSNTATVTDNEAVSVSDISAALFGTWSGKFNYNVEYNGEAGGSGTETPTPDPEQPSNPDDGDDGSEGEMVRYEFEPEDYDAKMGTSTATDAIVVIPATFEYDGITYQVNNIAQLAFSYNNNLTSVTISEGTKNVLSNAFVGCQNLTTVNIPASATFFDTAAFMNCTSLSTINYAGTMEQWNAMRLGQSWRLNVPATEVICSDGTVSLS